jgi:D-3-phosphoglycerate dehydrogenase
MQTTPLAGGPGAAGVGDNPLVLDLLDWLAAGPRPYVEVMEVWRTSCPRLPIWEDAVDAGLVVRRVEANLGPIVELTTAGRSLLAAARPLAATVAT